MKYQDLIGQINADINTNGNHEITGAKLNSALNEIISVLGDGFRISGEITPQSEAPADPENGMCYIAETSGLYVNFGNIEVNADEIAFIYYDSDNESWSKMGWPRKDFGLVVVDASTSRSFGEDEMTEVRKSVCFIIRNDADGVTDRLFVKDRRQNGFYWFYAAPMLSSDLDGDLILDQGCIQIRSTAEDGRYPYETVSIGYKLSTKGNVAHALSLKADKVTDATQGNLASLDSSGNLTDSGISYNNIVRKSQTSGLLKNDGTVDTTQYGTYSKPNGGIPKTDLATAVQTSLGLADTAVQTETDPVFSASAAAGITSTDIAEWDGKAEPTPVVDASTIPSSMEPNKLYKYGTLSGNTVFPPFATPTDQTIANVYWWKFTTPSTAPTITWPAAVTEWAGGQAPNIDASTTYEITVEDGFAAYIKS